MNCKIVLHAILRQKLPSEARGVAFLDLPEGSVVKDILARFELPQNCVCTVNNQLERDIMQTLHEDDEVHFFLPSSGG